MPEPKLSGVSVGVCGWVGVCVLVDACLIRTDSTIVVLKAETKTSCPHNHTLVAAKLQQEKPEQRKRK